MTRIAALVLAFVLSGFSFQGAGPPSDATAAADALRGFYFDRVYEEGALRGEQWVAAFPESTRLRAWWLLNRGRNSEVEDACAEAEKMTQEHAADPWAWFALSGTLSLDPREKERALETSEKMIALLPDDPDAVWLRATVMCDKAELEPTVAFIEQGLAKERAHTGELLSTLGSAYRYLSGKDDPQSTLEKALQAFEKARLAEPDNVSAHYLAASYLYSSERYSEALELVSKASELSAGSNTVHGLLWDIEGRLPDRDKAEAQAAIGRSMDAFLSRRGQYPVAWYTAYNRARRYDLTEKSESIAERILERFPQSAGAEWALVDRYRALSKRISEEEPEPDSDLRKEYRKALEDFIHRPKFTRKTLLGDAYRSLFYVLKDDPDADPAQLLETVQGMVRYEGINTHIIYGQGPIALADRTSYFKEAEDIARQGLIAGREKVESQRKYYKTQEDFEGAQEWMEGTMRDALGWVFFKSGRIEEAKAELEHAYELSTKDAQLLFHLGTVYEKTGDLDAAERLYVRGFSIQAPGENPCEKAVKALYERRHAGLDGFEAYRGSLAEVDRENRRQEVVEGRLENPSQPGDFTLERLDGSKVSLSELRGKVVVVHFWGIWCGWCLKEIDEYQHLYDRYKDDPDVVLLALDHQDDPRDVPDWMKKKGYTFDVVLDDGYVSKEGVHAFPNTWFLDQQGRKVYEREGWSEFLLEEFSWRIEALREATPEAVPQGQ